MTENAPDHKAPLRNCEEAVEDSDELQWREVHPQWVANGVVARDAFVGVPASRAEVSTVRSSRRTAEQAHLYYVKDLGLKSAGTWAVAVAEVVKVSARVVDDAACDNVDTPGHSFIDLRNLTKPQQKAARVDLATRATSRGRQCPEAPGG
jgi:hypothetical protein